MKICISRNIFAVYALVMMIASYYTGFAGRIEAFAIIMLGHLILWTLSIEWEFK